MDAAGHTHSIGEADVRQQRGSRLTSILPSLHGTEGREYGLDKPATFDLPAATSRLHDGGADLSRVLLANTAYGQGQLQVTPLQMTLITAAVANGGTIPQPHLVTRETMWSTGQLSKFADQMFNDSGELFMEAQRRHIAFCVAPNRISGLAGWSTIMTRPSVRA